MSNTLVEEKVVCPHCWHDFYGDHASFISQHSKLYGDRILGDAELQRFSHLEVKRDRDGNALDPKGWQMVERACPRCHLQVPPDLLVRRPKFISIVGASRSGKTYFFTAMLHFLREELAQYFNFTLEVCDYHEKNIFSKYALKLFASADPLKPTQLPKTVQEGDLYTKVPLDGVTVLLPKPFIFSLRSSERDDRTREGQPSSLVFYDNSGESFRFRSDDDGERRSTQHLGESDVVFFAYDLLLNHKAHHKLKSVSKDPQVTDEFKSESQEDILTEVIQRIRRYKRIPADKRLDVNLVICVQKYDVWKSLIPFGNNPDNEKLLIDHTSIEYFAHHGVAGLDIHEMNAISLLVRKLIHDFSPGFVASAEANFKRVRFFPVSALGRSPTKDGDLFMIQPNQIQPFRVTHPMLWMLHEWRLISGAQSSKDNPKGYPAAVHQKGSADRIHVLSPSSGSLLKLDAEYAGSSIVDPDTGKWIWIPSLSTNGNTPSTKTDELKLQDTVKKSPEKTDLTGHGLGTRSTHKEKKSWMSRWFGGGSGK